jgi:hypothetical protein
MLRIFSRVSEWSMGFKTAQRKTGLPVISQVVQMREDLWSSVLTVAVKRNTQIGLASRCVFCRKINRMMKKIPWDFFVCVQEAGGW